MALILPSVRSLSQHRDELLAANEQLQKQIVEERERASQTLKEQLDALIARIEEKEALVRELAEASTSAGHWQRQAERLEQEKHVAVQELAQIKVERTQLEAARNQLDQKAAKSEAENKTLTRELDRATASGQHWQAQAERLEREKHAAVQELAQLKVERTQLQAQLSQSKNIDPHAITALERERNEAQAARDSYQQENASLKAAAVHTQEVMQALKSSCHLVQVAPDQVDVFPKSFTTGLLSTMPRSGTWYAYYVFQHLNEWLGGEGSARNYPLFDILPALQLAKAHMHMFCPGFESYEGEYRAEWEALNLPQPLVYDNVRAFLAANESVFSPERNPGLRTVYLYRNPLDQMVSMYHHLQNHVHASMLPKWESVADFARRGGLDAYIKQYFTFHAMRERLEGQLLMIPYEALMADPAAVFQRMLVFWNREVDRETTQALKNALERSSIAAMQSREQEQGHSLASDQTGKTQTHLRGGEIGKWKEHFSAEDIAWVRGALASFGIKLEDFVTERAQTRTALRKLAA